MNNIDKIKDLLLFEDDDTFYHLQILKRKKEHPDLESNTRVVKTYYISSFEYLIKKMDEIINICDFHNARACINLNKRSYEKIAFHTLRKVTDCIMNKDFRAIRKAYDSVCGAHSNETDNKKWIIDIDSNDNDLIDNVIAYLCEYYITTIPTKNGCHIISRPFRLDVFKQLYNNIDIHKDNPTLLYWKEN